eukprot:jgi/Ulvmu1/8554/UM044_0088.1
MSEDNVFFSVVVPVVGGVVAMIMFASPSFAVLKARRENSLGAVNTLPFAMTMANCVCWTTYAFLIDDWFLVIANSLGFLIGATLFLASFGIGVPDARARDRVLAVCLADAAILFTVTILERMVVESQTAKEQLWGYTANVMLVFFFLSPLSTLLTVVRRRDSASLVLPLCIMNFLNGSLWGTYGLVRGDAFIWAPNFFGAALGVLQTTLRLSFPQRTPPEAAPLKAKSESTVQLTTEVPSAAQSDGTPSKERRHASSGGTPAAAARQQRRHASSGGTPAAAARQQRRHASSGSVGDGHL